MSNKCEQAHCWLCPYATDEDLSLKANCLRVTEIHGLRLVEITYFHDLGRDLFPFHRILKLGFPQWKVTGCWLRKDPQKYFFNSVSWWNNLLTQSCCNGYWFKMDFCGAWDKFLEDQSNNDCQQWQRVGPAVYYWIWDTEENTLRNGGRFCEQLVNVNNTPVTPISFWNPSKIYARP